MVITVTKQTVVTSDRIVNNIIVLLLTEREYFKQFSLNSYLLINIEIVPLLNSFFFGCALVTETNISLIHT